MDIVMKIKINNSLQLNNYLKYMKLFHTVLLLIIDKDVLQRLCCNIISAIYIRYIASGNCNHNRTLKYSQGHQSQDHN